MRGSGSWVSPAGSADAKSAPPAPALDEFLGGHQRASAIVVGFDRRPESTAALEAAADLASRLDAALYVVHVVDIRDYPIDPDSPDWEGRAQETIAGERASASRTLVGRELTWSFSVLSGDPAAGLARVAGGVDALMIVVGTRVRRWRGPLTYLPGSSVSRRLAKRAQRPYSR